MPFTTNICCPSGAISQQVVLRLEVWVFPGAVSVHLPVVGQIKDYHILFMRSQPEVHWLHHTINSLGVDPAPVFAEEPVMTVIRPSWRCLPLHQWVRSLRICAPHFRFPHPTCVCRTLERGFGFQMPGDVTNHLAFSLSREGGKKEVRSESENRLPASDPAHTSFCAEAQTSSGDWDLKKHTRFFCWRRINIAYRHGTGRDLTIKNDWHMAGVLSEINYLVWKAGLKRVEYFYLCCQPKTGLCTGMFQ